MNTFKDGQEYQMFVLLLKQKWLEFDKKLKDKFTVEIATDVASASKKLHLRQRNPLRTSMLFKNEQKER